MRTQGADVSYVTNFQIKIRQISSEPASLSAEYL